MNGVSQELQNNCFKGSTSLITSVSTTGIVSASKTSGLADGLMFVEYPKRLKKVLKEDFKINIKKLLDNYGQCYNPQKPCHFEFYRGHQTLSCLYSSVYAELNLIEKYFSILKNMVLRKIVWTRMRWMLIDAFILLNKCIFKIDADQVRKLWLSFT